MRKSLGLTVIQNSITTSTNNFVKTFELTVISDRIGSLAFEYDRIYARGIDSLNGVSNLLQLRDFD